MVCCHFFVRLCMFELLKDDLTHKHIKSTHKSNTHFQHIPPTGQWRRWSSQDSTRETDAGAVHTDQSGNSLLWWLSNPWPPWLSVVQGERTTDIHRQLLYMAYLQFSIVGPDGSSLTCHCPMFSTLCPKGLWRLVQSFRASLRISMMLLIRAHMAARGNAEEKSTT